MLRKALIAAAALALAAAPAAQADALGKTPGTYSPWSVPEDATQFTVPMTLQHDPGNYNAYWSTQFRFTGGNTGYIGFQTHGDGGGMFLVSVWGGTTATVGNNGSYCQDFNEGGSGKTCRNNTRPVEDHQYEMHGARQSDGSWAFSYTDLTAHTLTRLGTIKFSDQNDNMHNNINRDSFNSWTEYFDWNNPKTTCSEAKYSKLLFGVPHTQGVGGKSDTGTYGKPYDSGTCPGMAKVTVGADGATHEDGPLPVSQQRTSAGSGPFHPGSGRQLTIADIIAIFLR